MQRKTGLFIAAGAATLLALGGFSSLAMADQNCEGGHGPGMHRMMGGDHDMGGRMGGWHGGWGGRGGGMIAMFMERYDTNKDGKITQQEIDQNRTDWLNQFDADKNGTLSLTEFQALWLKARNEMMVREFQSFDRDGNGQVTLEEYKGPLSDVVENRDRNGDGALSRDDRGGRMGRGMMGKGMGGGMGGGMMGCDGPGQSDDQSNDDGGDQDQQ